MHTQILWTSLSLLQPQHRLQRQLHRPSRRRQVHLHSQRPSRRSVQPLLPAPQPTALTPSKTGICQVCSETGHHDRLRLQHTPSHRHYMAADPEAKPQERAAPAASATANNGPHTLETRHLSGVLL